MIVNCGVSHVSVSVFSNGEDGILRLEQVCFAYLKHDFSVEEQWLDGVEAGLRELKSEHGLSGEAHFILPGSLLLIKTIRVPHVEESKQDQIVTFELQQKMPYPLTDLVWGYQVVEDDGVEQEVLAAAVRPDIAEAFCERMDTIGIRPVDLSAASILDYNAMRHSHIDLKDGEMLVINVGAKSSNLLFINPEGFLIRNIGLGGNSLTQHIADNLGVSFANAEDIKTRYFSGKTAFAADDPGVAVMQKNAGQFMTRLSQEVTRSVVTYKRQKKGKAPSRVFLTGRGALLPGLPEYLSETQGLSVDYFDPLRAIRVSETVPDEVLQEAVFLLSEVVGEAGRQFERNTEGGLKGIDLLPKDKKVQMNFRPKKWALVLAAVILSLVPLPGILQERDAQAKLASIVDDRNKFANAAAAEANKRSNAKEGTGAALGFQELEILNQALAQEMEPFTEMLEASGNWKGLLADLQNKMNQVGHVWIDTLEVKRRPANASAGSGFRSTTSASQEEIELRHELTITGKVLFPVDGIDFPDDPTEEIQPPIQGKLRELYSSRIQALTEAITQCDFVLKIEESESDIDKIGKLNQRYAYFKYVLITKPDRPL